MPNPTEAEARAAVDELEAFIESFSRGLYERLNALGEYAKELGRATERELRGRARHVTITVPSNLILDAGGHGWLNVPQARLVMRGDLTGAIISD